MKTLFVFLALIIFSSFIGMSAFGQETEQKNEPFIFQSVFSKIDIETINSYYPLIEFKYELWLGPKIGELEDNSSMYLITSPYIYSFIGESVINQIAEAGIGLGIEYFGNPLYFAINVPLYMLQTVNDENYSYHIGDFNNFYINIGITTKYNTRTIWGTTRIHRIFLAGTLEVYPYKSVGTYFLYGFMGGISI
jgi:hypothetical protein